MVMNVEGKIGRPRRLDTIESDTRADVGDAKNRDEGGRTYRWQTPTGREKREEE